MSIILGIVAKAHAKKNNMTILIMVSSVNPVNTIPLVKIVISSVNTSSFNVVPIPNIARIVNVISVTVINMISSVNMVNTIPLVNVVSMVNTVNVTSNSFQHIGQGDNGAPDPSNEAQGGQGMIDEYIPLPGDEDLDHLTLQLGYSDWIIKISPADRIEYQQDPAGYDITSIPLRGDVTRQIAIKLMENHSINTNQGRRILKLISRPNTRPPWRFHLRLLNDDNAQNIIHDFTANGLQVPQAHDTLRFIMDMNPASRAQQSNHIGYIVKWGIHMQVTQAMIDDMIVDFNVRIPESFPKILTTTAEGTIEYTGHWEVSRAMTGGYDVRADMRSKANDNAVVFMVNKESLMNHTQGIHRNIAAPPYVFMPVIEHNQGKVVKLDVDIMGFGYCKGERTTHDPSKQDDQNEAYSDKADCVYCTREYRPEMQRLANVNRCRNLLCRIDLGIKARDPAAYEQHRNTHDCVLTQRRDAGQMMDYSPPKIPTVEKKTWTQVAAAEHIQGSLSIELRAEQARKEASAAQARHIREAAAKAQADQVPRPNIQRNQTPTHQAKKRKVFGGYPKW